MVEGSTSARSNKPSWVWLFDISTLPSPNSTCLERLLCLFLSTAEVNDEANLAVVEEVSAPIWRAEKLAWQRSVN